MIVICFGDGLGNQMFQYAFWCSIEQKYPNCKVLADIGNVYGKIAPHNGFELEKIFGIKLPECSKMKALSLADYYPALRTTHPGLSVVMGISRLLRGPKKSFIMVDDPTAFYPEVYELNELYDYIFRGNWINENYFRDVKDRLLDEFSFPELDNENEEIKKQIISTNSVSIHVRRGDYLQSDLCNLDIEYYKKAIKIVEEGCKESLTYFIFSDDIKYSEKQFSFLDNVVFVKNNDGINAYKDMQLMSYCKHNIIANSTFSFWGAFLNKNTDKIVVAPKTASHNFKNAMICEEWIKV